MGKLEAYEKQMLASPDQQISLTDPDSRSMATSGRGSGVVGYNVQVAVDTENHLIVTHEVTNSGSDRAQLASIAKQAKAVLQTETLDAVADRGYFNSPEILACHEAGITVTLPKPMTSGEIGRPFRITNMCGFDLRQTQPRRVAAPNSARPLPPASTAHRVAPTDYALKRMSQRRRERTRA
jgi:hypothetical protein